MVARRASCSSPRWRSAASSRARPMAMPAWLAAAVRISRSSGANALARLLSTTRTPTSCLLTWSGTSTSEPVFRVGR